MTGGDRGQRLIFKAALASPSLVAVLLSIETIRGNLVWHGQGRQVEMGRLARVIVVAGSTSGAPGLCFFCRRDKGETEEQSRGKWDQEDAKQNDSDSSKEKPTSASVGASECRARPEAGALVVLTEPSTSKTERHVVGLELRILWVHMVCARRSDRQRCYKSIARSSERKRVEEEEEEEDAPGR